MQTGISDHKVVVFSVGREEYAVPITAVKEVVTWTPPTPVPEAPAVVEGVVNLRGEIIPVIDLGRLFRATRLKANEEARIIVMEVGGEQAGFVVDEVSHVHTVLPESVAPPSPVLRNLRAGPSGEIVSGIIKLGENRLVVMVDVVRIMAATGQSA